MNKRQKKKNRSSLVVKVKPWHTARQVQYKVANALRKADVKKIVSGGCGSSNFQIGTILKPGDKIGYSSLTYLGTSYGVWHGGQVNTQNIPRGKDYGLSSN